MCAYQIPGQVVSYESSGDLSAQQFRAVKCGTADGSVVLATALTDNVIGVLQNTPTTGGSAVAIMLSGISKMMKDSTSAAVTYGDPATITTGGGVKSSTGGVTDFVIGVINESMAAGTTGVVSVNLTMAGKGSSGT